MASLEKWQGQLKPEKEYIIAEFRDEPKHLVIEYSNFAHFKLCNCLQVTSMSALQRTISSSANYGVLPTEELKPGFSVERFVCGRSFQKQTLIKLKNSGKSFFCVSYQVFVAVSPFGLKNFTKTTSLEIDETLFSHKSQSKGGEEGIFLFFHLFPIISCCCCCCCCSCCWCY